MRTIVNLPEDQIAALAEVCRCEGLSRTEAVRRAVADYLVARQTVGREEAAHIQSCSKSQGTKLWGQGALKCQPPKRP